MLLTEIIKDSTLALESKRRAQESKKSADEYVKALRQLDQVRIELSSILFCAEELLAKGLSEHPLMTQQTKDDLIEYTNDCGDGVYNRTLTMDTVKAFKAKSDAVSDQVKGVWKTTAVKYSEGTLGYLSMIGGLSEDPKRAKELEESISKTANGTLSVTAIKKLIEDVEEARKFIDAFSLNAEVERFLKKVSLQQATIADLTPGIITWLQEKKLTGKLKIKF